MRRRLVAILALFALAVVVVAWRGWRHVIWPRSLAKVQPGEVPLALPEGEGKEAGREGRAGATEPEAQPKGRLVLLETLGEAGGPDRQARRVRVSPDGTTVAAGHRDGWIRTWDVRERPARLLQAFLAHEGAVDALAWAPDGTRIASAGGEEIVLWDPWTGRATLRLPRFSRDALGLAFSPDGCRLYASAREAVDVWDVATGEKKETLLGDEAPEPVVDDDGDGLSDKPFEGPLPKAPIGGMPPHVIAVGPDGSWLAAGDFTYPVRIIDTATGRLVRRLPGFSTPVSDVVATADGRLLTSSAGVVRIWDSKTWKEISSFEGPEGRIAASADGAWIFAMNGLCELGVWDARTGAVAEEVDVGSVPLSLDVHKGAIWVGCDDGTIRHYAYRP